MYQTTTSVLMQMPKPTQTPLSNPLTPRLPQLLRNLLHTNLEHTLDIPRQLRVIPVARHISPQIPTSPPRAIPKECDIARGVSARRPIDTRLLTQAAREVGGELVVLVNGVDLSLAQVTKSITRQDGVLQVRALIGAIVVLPEPSGALSSHACALEGQRIKPIKRQATALVVGGGQHHGVLMLVDPLTDELHYVIVHDGVVEVAYGVICVAGVVDAACFLYLLEVTVCRDKELLPIMRK